MNPIIKEGSLKAWFGQSKSKGGKPGWVQSDGSPCANEPGETKTPKCFSSSKLASMKKGEIASAVRRKREQDPGQQLKTGAAAPTRVSTDSPTKKMKKEDFVLESDIKGKGSGTKDACYHKVKARFKVWPSAYGSGALVKCRKAGAANWGNKSEESDMDQQCENDKKYCLLCKKNETRAECSFGPAMFDKYTIGEIQENHNEIASGKENDDEGYMVRTEFDKIQKAILILKKNIKKENQQIPAWVQSKITKAADYIDTAADYMDSDEEVSEACWAGYERKGTKLMFGKEYPNCVKKKKKKPTNENNDISEEPRIPRKPGQPAGSKKHSDLYTDENPKGTISGLGFKDVATAKQSVAKIKNSDKTHAHKIQAAVAMEQRAKEMGKSSEAAVFRSFIDSMKEKTKEMNEACWAGFKQVGMKKKGNKMVPNCVPEDASFTINPEPHNTAKKTAKIRNLTKSPNENESSSAKRKLSGPKLPLADSVEVKSFDNFLNEATAAWQRKAGKNPEGGLNAKGIASYRAENPGSKLSMAVTTPPSKLKPGSKSANRRKSFCARMGGMRGPMKDDKGRPTRKALALRKWNC